MWYGLYSNCVYATTSNFLIPMSYQPDGVYLWNFKFEIIWVKRIHSLKFLGSTTLGWKEVGIGKSDFVAKTQFL